MASSLMTAATRIGMLTPSSNTCLEPMTSRILADVAPGVSAHFSRIPVTSVSLEEESSAQFCAEQLIAAACLLEDAKVDVVVWNGTAGSWLGLEHDRQICQAIEEATGIPATSSTLALFDAFRAYGVTSLGLAVPYTREVADRIGEVYSTAGVTVVASHCLGITDNESFARVSPDRIRRLVTCSAEGNAQAVAVVCTNVCAAPAIAGLEQQLGILVLDSVTVTLWKALDLVNGAVAAPGWGTLLATGSTRARFQDVVDVLVAVTAADRVTLRLDHLAARPLNVDYAVAEALRPGVRSIRHDGGLDQRHLETVEWLEARRRPLIQPQFQDHPSPPADLVELYGVRAQMLSPLVRDDQMIGWMSVHSVVERSWTDSDQTALEFACQRILDLLNAFDQSDGIPQRGWPS